VEPLGQWCSRGVIQSQWRCINWNNVRGVFWPIKVSEALNITIVKAFDTFGRLVEASSNGGFEIWEVGVFNIPFRGLVIGFLVVSKSVTQCTDFFFEVIFKGSVVTFAGSDS
jgi:hypothetical protein